MANILAELMRERVGKEFIFGDLLFRRAETQAEREAAFALRHRVFTAEGFIDPDRFPDGLFRDAFDDVSAHFLVLDGESVVGTTRFVLPSSLGYPTEHFFDFERPDVPRSKLGEFGRLAIDAPHRGGARAVMFGLLKAVFECMLERGIVFVYAFLPPKLAASYTALGCVANPLRVSELQAGTIERRRPMAPYFASQEISPVLFSLEEMLQEVGVVEGPEAAAQILEDAGPHGTPPVENEAEEVVRFDPFSADFRVDPYSQYHRLRTHDPVHWSELGFWCLTRYADVEAVLRDPDFEIAPEAATGRVGEDSLIGRLSRRSFLFLNPPDHSRIRGRVSRAFTPRRTRALLPRMRGRVEALLDRVASRGEMDLIADFAYPLPIATICEMVGVPSRDWDRIREWSDDLSPMVDPVVSAEQLAVIEKAAAGFSQYLLPLAAERRRRPKGDLLSVLVSEEGGEEPLTDDEVLGTCILLLAAGHQTTTHLIGNGTIALLRHPVQLEKVQADGTLIPDAVEECLRYESPIHVTFRWPRVDTELGGKVLRAGDRVAILFGAANRDPGRFPEPDSFDLSRPDNRHLAFSAGIHHCIGSTLARQQAHIAFEALLRRMPDLALAVDEPDWKDTVTVRGVRALPVTF